MRKKCPEVFTPLIMAILNNLENEGKDDTSEILEQVFDIIIYNIARYWVFAEVCEGKESTDKRFAKLTPTIIWTMYTSTDGWNTIHSLDKSEIVEKG